MPLPAFVRPLCLTPFLLALAPVADEIAFAPKAESEVAKKLAMQVELKFQDVSVTVDGQPMPGEALGEFGNQSMLLDLAMDVTEKYVASKGGRPIDLLRTFDEVSLEAEFGDQRNESSMPKLAGKTVRFRWNEDEKTYEKSLEGGEGGDDLLDALGDDMDLRLLLPAKKVSEGDTWDVDGKGLMALFLPGFAGGDFGGGGLDGEGAEVVALIEDELGQQFAAFLAEFKVHCKYEGLREEGGVPLARIRFDYDGGPKLDLAGLIERLAEKSSGGEMPEFDLTADLAIGMKGEGTLDWDQSAARLSAFEMKTDLTLSFDVDADVSEGGEQHTLSMTGSLGGTAGWTLKAAAP